MTVKEFTILYGVDRTTVYRRIQAGQLIAYKKPSAHPNASPTYYIEDPGWQRIGIRDNGKSVGVDDIYILNAKEVAEILGVSTKTVQHMADTGRIDFRRTGTYGQTHRRYSIRAVRDAIARKGQKRRGSACSRQKKREIMIRWAKERLGITGQAPGQTQSSAAPAPDSACKTSEPQSPE